MRRQEAVAALEQLEDGVDPVEAARRELAAAETRYDVARSGATSRTRRCGRAVRRARSPRSSQGSGWARESSRSSCARMRRAVGRDEVVFLVRLNRGLSFAPVADTASGGELSRIALALAAVAAGASKERRTRAREGGGGTQTLVFDEIDAGIGGQTAHHVAETLRRLAARVQVVTITHLPQIASVADAHFRVEKVAGDPTQTVIERLDDAERRDELERMLGGQEFLATLTGSAE